MGYIRYNDSEQYIPAAVIPIQPNVVRVTPVVESVPNTSGFHLYLSADDQYPLDSGEYMSYTTLYRQGDGYFELSSDGSIYVEPEVDATDSASEETAEEFEKQQQVANINSQISALKTELSDTDYQIIKMYEYSLVYADTGYDITGLHTQRQALRDQINVLEEQLSEIL